MASEMYADVVEDLVPEMADRLKDENLAQKANKVTMQFVVKNMRILAFSNDEFQLYQKMMERLSLFSLEDFEEVVGQGTVPNVKNVREAVLKVFGDDFKMAGKQVQGALVPEI